MGAPGQGKSKLLELLIRHDMDEGHGCCLIDPSEQGSTARKALHYAISKGYKKIVIIDADDIQKYKLYPTINPIIYNAPLRAIKAHVSDCIRVLFNQKDSMFTTKINKYLPAVVAALYAGKYTLHEAKYFLSRTRFAAERTAILNKLPPDDLSRVVIEDSLTTLTSFGSFESTINRLIPFFEDTTRLMFASNARILKEGKMVPTSMNFQKLIAEGYLILVTLEAAEWGEDQQRLIGTIVINQLIRAKQRLWKKGYTKPYYLYIDEVGQYATSKLAYIMNYERHINLRMTVAHQNMEQVEDIKKTLKSSARTKVLFYTADPDDRLEFAKMLYGGDVNPSDAAYVLSELRKQNADIRIDKQKPVITRLKNLPDIKVSAEEVDEFKKKYIYNPELNPFYRTKEQVEEEINNRFAIQPRTATKARTKVSYQPKPATPAKPARTNNTPRITGDRSEQPIQQETSARPRRSPIFDDSSSVPPVLRDESRRTTRKRPDSKT